LVYVAASVRKGTWMIPAFHGVLDVGVGDHDDPQHFELQKCASMVQVTVEEVEADRPSERDRRGNSAHKLAP
jgi:hypothetical protein